MDEKSEESRDAREVKEEKKEEFTFSPRPEAHAMRWGELMSPLRHAVRDLLLLLDGSVSQIDRSTRDTNETVNVEGEQVTASCFLVYGEHGTGKSTVLLSARDAVCKESKYFFSSDVNPQLEANEREREFRNDALESAKRLRDKGTIWLDVLDLESLPPRQHAHHDADPGAPRPGRPRLRRQPAAPLLHHRGGRRQRPAPAHPPGERWYAHVGRHPGARYAQPRQPADRGGGHLHRLPGPLQEGDRGALEGAGTQQRQHGLLPRSSSR